MLSRLFVRCGCIIAEGEGGSLRETEAKFTKIIRKTAYKLRQSPCLLFRFTDDKIKKDLIHHNKNKG